MPKDQAYLEAEKKIGETLKSGATDIQYPFFCSLFVGKKGGYNGK